MSMVLVETPALTSLQPFAAVYSRPWLSLYNVRLKPKPVITVSEEDLAPIQLLFPDELMFNVFARLGPYTLGTAACVCKQWKHFSENPKHWEVACRQAFTAAHKSADTSQHTLIVQYRGCWRRMFLSTPHVRFDGLYVSRNTYVRQGAVEWRRQQTCHLVTYYRYYRFFPDGTLLYRTSPHVVSKVAKSMQRNPVNTAKQSDAVSSGRYAIKGKTVFCVVTYPNSRMTEIRSRLALRSTYQGANNRLDIEAIYSFDRELGMAMPFTAPDEDPDGDLARKEYNRGLSCCVFVPWESVNTTVLNLPAKEMDFFMAG